MGFSLLGGIMIDLKAMLGADEVFSVQKFSIYLPNKDNKHNLIDNIESHVKECMLILSRINMGCTVQPNLPAMWKVSKSPDEDKFIIQENTYLVYSFISDPEKFLFEWPKLLAFLYKFGLETKQDAVMVQFTGDNGLGVYIDRAYLIPRRVFLKARRDAKIGKIAAFFMR
jgi:hypothetical protein